MHDISAPTEGYIYPDATHVTALIEFAHRWDADSVVLVHCLAGISRSTAAALVVLCAKQPGREIQAARQLRAAAPHAQPNSRIIQLADELLGCQGRLIAARATMGPSQFVPDGPLIRLTIPE